MLLEVLEILPNYAKIMPQFANPIACCTHNSLIGLGLKYIEILKSLKAKICSAKTVSTKGHAYHIWTRQSHKPRRQYRAGGHFHFASSCLTVLYSVDIFLAIMANENLSYHESTGSENDEASPASPRGSFNGDTTLEEGELTVPLRISRPCKKPVCH